MVRQKVVFNYISDLHVRVASLFAMQASMFDCKVEIHSNNKVYNGKSILSLVSAEIQKGKEFEIVVDGRDEEKVLEYLVGLLKTGLSKSL